MYVSGLSQSGQSCYFVTLLYYCQIIHMVICLLFLTRVQMFTFTFSSASGRIFLPPGSKLSKCKIDGGSLSLSLSLSPSPYVFHSVCNSVRSDCLNFPLFTKKPFGRETVTLTQVVHQERGKKCNLLTSCSMSMFQVMVNVVRHCLALAREEEGEREREREREREK